MNFSSLGIRSKVSINYSTCKYHKLLRKKCKSLPSKKFTPRVLGHQRNRALYPCYQSSKWFEEVISRKPRSQRRQLAVTFFFYFCLNVYISLIKSLFLLIVPSLPVSRNNFHFSLFHLLLFKYINLLCLNLLIFKKLVLKWSRYMWCLLLHFRQVLF